MSQPLLSPHEASELITEAAKRTTELEIARNEMEFLYEASNKLVRASSPAEQLEAVSGYAQSIGANRGVLVYIEFDGGDRIDEVVAEWAVGHTQPFGIGRQFRFAPADRVAVQSTIPHNPVFFENASEDERLRLHLQEIYRQYSILGCAFLPLYYDEQLVAGVTFGWDYPRIFDDRDNRIFTVLQQQIGFVVDAVRLFERLQRRATELELANSELNMLYKSSEMINSANTYEEVVEAVAQFDLEADVVTLMLWDTWDWQTAQFLDVLVVIDRQNSGKLPVGSRLPKEAFPIAKRMMGHRVWLIEDGHTDPRVDPVTAESWEALGIRSFMGPALYINQRWIGGITFHSSKPRKYTRREERLLAGVGDLVLAAIIRIRLQNEKDTARLQAEKLGQVNALLSQATDESAILNAVAELFQDLGVAWFGLAYSRNQPGFKRTIAEYVATIPRTEPAYPAGLFDLNDYPCLKTAYDLPNGPIFVENVEIDPRAEFRYLLTKPETEKWKAVIILPLQAGDDWHGLMSFYWYQPQVFSREIQDIFTAIMPNVASVVTIRKTYLAEQEARKENELLYETSKGINNAATVDEIVTALEQLELASLDISLAIWENYNRDSATYLEFVAGSINSRWQVGNRIAVEEMRLAYATAHHQLVVVDDSINAYKIDRSSASLLEAQGYHSLMLVHLLVVNHCIGVLMFCGTERRVFSPHEQRLAASAGELATAAIERIRLREETEAARREAEINAQQAQKLASLEERTRLARELHDSVSQVLFGIGLGARTALAVANQNPSKLKEPLDYILSLADAGLTEMRALIFELRPESLEQEGLITTLEKQALSIEARYNIHVETQFCDEPELALEVKESVYRVIREALHNTVKHAQASSVQLTMICANESYCFIVKDNGLGFDTTRNFTGHLGLKSMRERVTTLGGQLDITSQVGAGTTVSVTVPA